MYSKKGKKGTVKVKEEKSTESTSQVPNSKIVKTDNSLNKKKGLNKTVVKSENSEFPLSKKSGKKTSKSSNNATSTPNDRIQENKTNPELPPKHANFLDKFYFTPVDPKFDDDESSEFISTVDEDEEDEEEEEEDSLSPCKNIKQVKKNTVPVKELQLNMTPNLLAATDIEIKQVKKRRKLDLVNDVVKPENYPIFGDVLTESFDQNEDLTKLKNDKFNIDEFYKNSQSNIEEWSIEGLRLSSNYEKIMKQLVFTRLKFSSQVNNLKFKIDQYGLALTKKKIKLEAKSANLQLMGRKFVEEAKSF